MFLPQVVKEFDNNGICSIKLAGVLGKTLDSYSTISISASEALSDILSFCKKDNIQNFDQGKVIPSNMFRKDMKSKKENDKPWIPYLHPIMLFSHSYLYSKTERICD